MPAHGTAQRCCVGTADHVKPGWCEASDKGPGPRCSFGKRWRACLSGLGSKGEPITQRGSKPETPKASRNTP